MGTNGITPFQQGINQVANKRIGSIIQSFYMPKKHGVAKYIVCTIIYHTYSRGEWRSMHGVAK